MNLASLTSLVFMSLMVSCSTLEKASNDVLRLSGRHVAEYQLRVYWASYYLEIDESRIVKSRFLNSLRRYARGREIEILLETTFQAHDLDEQRRILAQLNEFMNSNDAKVKQVTWLSSARSFIAIDTTLEAAMLRIRKEPAHFRNGDGINAGNR